MNKLEAKLRELDFKTNSYDMYFEIVRYPYSVKIINDDCYCVIEFLETGATSHRIYDYNEALEFLKNPPFEVLHKVITKVVFEDYRDNRQSICKLFVDKNLDLNQHRDMIQKIAMFTVNQTDAYWTRSEARG